MFYEKGDYLVASNRVFREEGATLLAEISFPELRRGVVDFNHTFVDNSLRGQGIAQHLVTLALEVLDKTNQKAIATCPYVISWVSQNPELAQEYFIEK